VASRCYYIGKSQDSNHKVIYTIDDGNDMIQNPISYSLADGSMIYDTKEECTSFCTKDGDKNYIVYKSEPNTNSG
jgi:hypothetical protein